MSSFRGRRPGPDEPRPAPKPGKITAIEPQQRDNARVNIFIDGAFAFGLHIDLQLEHYLKTGDHLDDAKITRLLKQDQTKKAISTALNLLAYRPRSTGELTTKLCERGYAPDEIEGALHRIRELGYVDDRDFADRWVESRQTHRPRSSRMLKQELQQKGIEKEIIEATIEEAGIDEYGDALKLAEKKTHSFRDLEPTVRERRISGFLARRGYGYDVIRRVLEAIADGESG